MIDQVVKGLIIMLENDIQVILNYFKTINHNPDSVVAASDE